MESSTDIGGIERKNRSNEKISKMGIPICKGLPILEDDIINSLKSVDEICKRAIVTLLSIQLACDINEGYDYNKSKEMFSNLLKEFQVEDKLNSKEKKIFDGTYKEKDILDMLDLFYRYHWACVEKRIKSDTNISDLNPEVVYERRRGL